MHVANTDGSEIAASSIVCYSLDICGHYLVELSRRERGFDSRWDHQNFSPSNPCLTAARDIHHGNAYQGLRTVLGCTGGRVAVAEPG